MLHTLIDISEHVSLFAPFTEYQPAPIHLCVFSCRTEVCNRRTLLVSLLVKTASLVMWDVNYWSMLGSSINEWCIYKWS